MAGAGPCSWPEAAIRFSLSDERMRASTALLMVETTTPWSTALSTVHLPVPFCPAVSRITSTSGLPVVLSICSKIFAVIWIR